MIELRCPGRLGVNAYVTTDLVPCPTCGNTVEIFVDEVKFRCRCGTYVFRKLLPPCAQWCGGADPCFGFVGDFQQQLNNVNEVEELQEKETRFRELQARVVASLTKCVHPERKQQHDGKKTSPSEDE